MIVQVITPWPPTARQMLPANILPFDTEASQPAPMDFRLDSSIEIEKRPSVWGIEIVECFTASVGIDPNNSREKITKISTLERDYRLDLFNSLVQHMTPRQKQVTGFLMSGLSNKEIATKMSITESTVKAHVSEILRKLQVTTRTQAVIVLLAIAQ